MTCPRGESETAAPTATTDRACTGAGAQSPDSSSSSSGGGSMLGIVAGAAGGGVLLIAIVLLIVLRRARAARRVRFLLMLCDRKSQREGGRRYAIRSCWHVWHACTPGHLLLLCVRVY